DPDVLEDGRRRVDLAAGCGAGQRLLQPCSAGVGGRLPGLHDDHVEAGARGDLRDAGSHETAPDYADSLHLLALPGRVRLSTVDTVRRTSHGVHLRAVRGSSP